MNVTALTVAIVLVVVAVVLRYTVIWRSKYGNAIVFIMWFVFNFLGGLIVSVILEKAPGAPGSIIAQRYGLVMFVLFLIWTAEETVKAVRKIKKKPDSG